MDHPGFFTVGTGRCGSTLVRKLLRFHPAVHLPKETHWIPLLHDRFGRNPISVEEFLDSARSVYMAKGKTALARILKEEAISEADLVAGFTAPARQTVAAWMVSFYRQLARRKNATIWGDKTPDYGACMGLLADLFPGARFLHVARDGRDVALSMSKVLSFRYQVAWDVNYWPQIAWKQAYAARAAATEEAIEDDRFFALWKSRLARIRDEARRVDAEACLEIRYEELLREPRAVLEQVHRHLQLPGDTAWIEPAAATVRSDNLGRNREAPRWKALSETHRDTLAEMGFR